MSHEDDMKKLMINYQRRLQKLKEQQALLGLFADPKILIEIEDIEAEIDSLTVDLKDSENKAILINDERLTISKATKGSLFCLWIGIVMFSLALVGGWVTFIALPVGQTALVKVFDFSFEWFALLLSIMSIFLGIGGLYFNIQQLGNVKREIQKRQEDAIDELRDLIRRPMIANQLVENLVTANFVRSNAIAISVKRACGEITIPMMGEAIRWVSLDLQQYFSGQQLKDRLEILNSILKELDSSMPPLLSLSSSDPLAGYYFGQIFIMIISAMIEVFIAVLFIATKLVLFLYLLVVPLIILIFFGFTTKRALKFFQFYTNTIRIGGQNINSLKNVHIWRVPDFFLYIFLFPYSKSSYLFWHVIFGPLWEQPLISLTPNDFVDIHGYRFLIARKISKELSQLQSRIIRKVLQGSSPSNSEYEQIEKYFDYLWVITGDKTLLSKKENWKNGNAFSQIHT